MAETTKPDVLNIRLSGPTFEPTDPAWKDAPEARRRAYWEHLGAFALDEKRREIRRGVDIHGKKLKPVKPKSRPDGATGPPLIPHYAESRSQALLAVKTTTSGATLYWKGHGRKSWSRILGYHAYKKGPRALPVRNIIGISPKGVRKLVQNARDWWALTEKQRIAKAKARAKKVVVEPEKPNPRPKTKPRPPIVVPPPLPPPPPPALPPPPKPNPRVVYLKKGQKVDPFSKKIQVSGSGGWTPKEPPGPKPPKAKPKPPPPPLPPPPVPPVPKPKPKPVKPVKVPIPIPVISRTLKPTPTPKPVPLKPTPKPKPQPKAKTVAVPPKPSVVRVSPTPKPPAATKPKPKPAPKQPPTFAEKMSARVDAEVKRLSAEHTAAMKAYTAAEAHWQAVKAKTVGITVAEYEGAKQARDDARTRATEVATLGNRFLAWRDDVKVNPKLIPPFPIAEQITLYRSRDGDAKVKAIASLRGQPFGLSGRSTEMSEILARSDELRHAYVKLDARDPTRKAMMDELAELNRRRRVIEGVGDEARHRRAEHVASLIAAEKPLSLTQAAAPTVEMIADPIPKEFQPTVDRGLAWLKSVVESAGLNGLAVPMGENGRVDLKRAHATKSGVVFEISDGPEIVVHEIGHYLDYHAGMNRAAIEFLDYRVGDEAPTPMSDVSSNRSYMADEVGRKDRFDEAFSRVDAYYVGKAYRGNAFTEITSMGLQKLYEDPIGFADRDPEYCAFILALLDGSIR